MKIAGIEKDSVASRTGLKIGDEVRMINHQPLHDLIDYAYHSSDESLVLSVQRGKEMFEVRIEKDADEDVGLQFEGIEFRCCGNHCIFCFVDQLPVGLRPTLYLKDEDYRLSFLHGSYVTLTGISDEDLHRIREQRLSPLYISVHSTDPDIRGNMIRGKDAGQILEKIEYLAQSRIEMHTQVVLCPGINDGPRLEQTIHDLSQ
jgi:putative radical SAM enzyme (TIGR03279 family)